MFVTPDSIVQNWYDPQMLNRYAYCRNNPLIYIDPSGHTLNNTETNSNDGEKDDKWSVQTDKAWEKTCLTEMQANINKKFQEYLKKTQIQICANSEEYFEYPIANTWDPKTNKRINKLDPAIQAMATAHINFLDEEYGSKVRLSSGLRTYKEQFDIYLQGRLSPGKVATNAPPGYSAHEYGLGYDLDFISGNYCSPGTIGRAGIAAGFDWGGNFKSIDDPRHFEVTTLYQKEVIWAGYSFDKKAKELYGNWCVFLGRAYEGLIFQ
jgi:peptidoglycan L-alanyl-D-glutamate endopeptidase CwlK